MKRIISFLLLFVLLFSTLSGCKSSSEHSGGDANVTVWTTDINNKVLLDNMELYSEWQSSKSISVIAAQNEKESSQIIITAQDGSVNEYTIELNDLALADGTKFSKQNIELFHFLYATVNSASRNYYQTAGLYPDGLLPYDTAIEYGKNKIAQDNNQTVMVRFNVPKDQKAGVYTGSITVKVDGESFSVPVELKVFDTAVSDTVTARSVFTPDWELVQAEADSSVDIRLKYAQFLADYRVSGIDILGNQAKYTTAQEIELWVELISQLWENSKISTLRLPTIKKKYESMTVNGRVYVDTSFIDFDITDKLLTSLVEKALVDNKNYLTKFFIHGLDEPQINGYTDEYITDYHKTIYDFLVEESDKIEKLRTSANGELIDQMKDSLMACPIITTDNKVTAEKQYVSYCPYYDKFQYQDARDNYIANSFNGVWWYGCNVPYGPYPNYHIDNSVISARLLSWMQFNYGVTGNLYWAVDDWEERASGNQPLYNYYDIDTTRAGSNGEGILVYPGKPYGIDGPIPTIRLEAIRDGLEEYEVLNTLDVKYKAVNPEWSFVPIMEILTDSLYSGMQVSYDVQAFNQSREKLYTLAELADDKAGNFMITNLTTQEGEYNFELYAKEGCVIKNNGVEISPTATVGAGKTYKLSVKLEGGVTGINLDISYNGNVYKLDWYLGASSHVYKADDLVSNFKAGKGNTLTTSIVPAYEIMGYGDDNYLRLALGETTSVVQNVQLSNDAIKAIGEGTKKLVINLYFDGKADQKQYLRLQFKYSKDDILSERIKTELKPGINTLELNNIYSYNWAKNGYIEYIYFGFSESKGTTDNPIPALNKIYVRDISIFDK